MENFTFFPATKYVFGRGVEMEAGRQLRDFGMKNVLIVYGKGSVVRSGLLARVKDSLSQAGISFGELGGIQPNPLDTKVYEGIEMCRANDYDGLLAVGGGSAIDTAKAIAAGAVYDGDFWDFYCGKAVIADALPVGVVLTIPAAGSEGSGNSVITRQADMRKISLRTDKALRPRFALMNPELTFTLPPFQTACGIADMMAHIMERYFTPTRDVEITDRVSEGVLMAIIEEAPKVMANPTDYQARANIMWSGTLAHNGICGTGRVEDWASHGLEHEISALYDVAHGAGLAVVFPAWMTYMAGVKPAKIAQLGRRVFGIDAAADDAAAYDTVARLRAFFKSLGLPVTFAELGIAEPDITTMVRKVTENKGNPFGGYYPITPEVAEAIYRLGL